MLVAFKPIYDAMTPRRFRQTLRNAFNPGPTRYAAAPPKSMAGYVDYETFRRRVHAALARRDHHSPPDRPKVRGGDKTALQYGAAELLF